MSNASDFVIENGVLTKYAGPGGDVVIPERVVEIGSNAFAGCSSLHSLTVPASVKLLGWGAFCNCIGLRELVICNADIIMDYGIFGDRIPQGLIANCRNLLDHFTAAALEGYFLRENVWNQLDMDLQLEIYLQQRGKSANEKSLKLMKEQAPVYGQALLKKLQDKLTSKQCVAVASFMLACAHALPQELLSALYRLICNGAAGKKAVQMLQNAPGLLTDIGQDAVEAVELHPTERIVQQVLAASKETVKAPVQNLQKYYSLKPQDLPELKTADGTTVTPTVMCWLLTAHEKTEKDDEYSAERVVAAWQLPGLRPEAEELIAALDAKSLQDWLGALANTYLGTVGRSKKMFLAFPICRYAGAELMELLTKTAPSWRSKVSGNNAPSLRSFREANAYNNTRAAILFAEHYRKEGDMKQYAALRKTSEDTIRDTVLSDIGVDANGCKTYDLGNQIVTAQLQSDLTFLIQLPSGKTAKSLPKNGADEEKYAAAFNDFAEIKKAAKKIVKNRAQVLFEDFLSGKKRPAESWQTAYLQNPLLRSVASLLVWMQGKATFTVCDGALVKSDGSPYVLQKSKSVALMHPMEIPKGEVEQWQQYFVSRGLKQPFEQVWEPVVSPDVIKENRYTGQMIPYYRFHGQEKHGIFVVDEDFHDYIDIFFTDCTAEMVRIDYRRHDISMNDRFEVKKFGFAKYTRQVNHIVTYLDKATIYGRIADDDVSIREIIPHFTAAQIAEFIKFAASKSSVNVTAMLLAYQQENFAQFDPMAEFVLE